jgi:hypothetical protein
MSQRVTNYVLSTAKFEVIIAVDVNVAIFWDITPCSRTYVNLRFGGTYPKRLLTYGLDGNSYVYRSFVSPEDCCQRCEDHCFSRFHLNQKLKNSFLFLLQNGFLTTWVLYVLMRYVPEAKSLVAPQTRVWVLATRGTRKHDAPCRAAGSVASATQSTSDLMSHSAGRSGAYGQLHPVGYSTA